MCSSDLLEPQITGELFEADGLWYVAVKASVKNVGISRAEILQRGTWIEIILLRKSPKAEPVPVEFAVGKAPIFEKHKWAEPGEEVHDVCPVQLGPKGGDDIAVRLNLRVVSKELYWAWTEIDAIDESNSDQVKLVRERKLEWNAGCVVRFEKPALPWAEKEIVQ